MPAEADATPVSGDCDQQLAAAAEEVNAAEPV
jgi:hypothetical protein